LQGNENLAKKAKDPEDWLNDHYQNSDEQKSAYKERNYIQKDFQLEWDRIEAFEEYRTKKIKESLEKIFNLKK